MENKEFNILDVLSVASFLLGYENLIENRNQSAQSDKLLKQNDVNQANDKQAKYLLTELGRKFDEQNEMLKQIISRLG